MRTIRICILFMLLNYSCFGQKGMASKEKELRSYLNKVSDWYDKIYDDSLKSISPFDSIAKYDSVFTYKLLWYVKNYPSTLNWSFSSLSNGWASINVLTSTDGLFRIYSWDNQQGGTARSYTNIIQYKDNNKVNAYLEEMRKEDGGYDQGTLYYDIYTLKTKDITYYIVSSHDQLESYHYYDAVKVFTVDNGQVNDSVKIFKTKTGLHNSISYEWRATGQFHTKEGAEYDNSIEFDKSKQSIR